MRTKLLTAILSIALLMSLFGTSIGSATLTTQTPIVINGDTDLSSYPGTGSVADPKVIANLSIDGNGGVGLSISNVNMHVTIFNCTIFNSSYGIKIVGSNNVLVDNNTINGRAGTHGIYLDSSTAYLDRNKLKNCSVELKHNDSKVGVQAYIDAITITSSNTVNGAAVYFLKNTNMNNASIPSGKGEVILLNVTYAVVSGQNMHGGALMLWSSHITVENSMITGTYDAIYVYSSSNCTIRNNQIVDMWHTGVRLFQSSHNAVSNITIIHQAISSSAYGIVVINGSMNNAVLGSTVHDTYEGIVLSYSNGNRISNNSLFHSLGAGLYMESSNGNTVSNNVVNGSSWKGIFSQLSHRNVIYNNTLSGARNVGIDMWRSFGDIISGNRILNSASLGINLTLCNGTVNVIYANALIGNNGSTSVYNANAVQAFDNSVNNWNNGTKGNYWGDWTAPDANKDGIVDSPYLVAGAVSSDNYPVSLMVKIISPPSHLYTNSTNVVLSGMFSGYIAGDVTWHNQASGVSGKVIGTGSFTATVALVLGINNITVNATDSQGLKVSDHVIVTYDTVGSNLAIVSPANNSYNNTGSVTVTWTAVNSISGIAKTEISADGITWTTVTGTSHLLTLVDGAYVTYVKVTDNAGNVNQTSVAFTVDTVKPVVVISSPANNSYNNTGSVTVTWVASDANSGIAKTEISTDGTAWTTVTGTSHVLTLADGAYTVHVKVTDNAGNVNQTSVALTVDTVKPVVVITSPISGSVNTNGSVTVQWTASDAVSGIAKTEISSDGTNWTTVTGTSHVLTLADGDYTVIVKATDNAGNVNQSSVAISVQMSAPEILNKSPVGIDVARGAIISVQFSVLMNESDTTISVNGVAGAVTWNGNTATFVPTSLLAYNTVYTVTVSGSGLSGKALNATSWSFTTLKDEGKITGTLKDSSAKAIAGAKVTLSNGMNTTTDANGNFELKNVTSGAYTLTIVKDGFKTITKSVSTGAGETTDLGTMSAQANDSNNDSTLLIVIVVIVIVALIAGAFVVMKRKKKE